MPAKKHPVILTAEEQATLQKAARSNKRSLLERRRARVLLASAEGQSDALIARELGVHVNTVINTRTRFAARGTKSVRRAEPTKRKARALDGQAEAPLIALVCAGPPAGRKTWTMDPFGRPLDPSARGGLGHRGDRAPNAQKNALKPWLKKRWGLPPKANAEFVAAIEDVREVYHRPFDPTRPQVCLDEASKQLLADVRAPLPIKPGEPERVDGEYTRHGTAAPFYGL